MKLKMKKPRWLRSLNVIVRLIFCVPRKTIRLEFDRNYGVNNRTGWTVVIDGITCSELERWLIVALVKGWWKRFQWDLDCV